MSAELLREAAALMRERAEAATPGPWEAFRRHAPLGMDVIGVSSGAESVDFANVFEDDSILPRDAEHIASWHPGVGLLFADLLDACADRADEMADSLPSAKSVRRAVLAANIPGYREALFAAAAYLGRES